MCGSLAGTFSSREHMHTTGDERLGVGAGSSLHHYAVAGLEIGQGGQLVRASFAVTMSMAIRGGASEGNRHLAVALRSDGEARSAARGRRFYRSVQLMRVWPNCLRVRRGGRARLVRGQRGCHKNCSCEDQACAASDECRPNAAAECPLHVLGTSKFCWCAYVLSRTTK